VLKKIIAPVFGSYRLINFVICDLSHSMKINLNVKRNGLFGSVV
jgi:hypothetical protein